MAFDGKAFGAEIVGVVKEFVSKEMASVLSCLKAMDERFEVIEKRLDALPTPRDGTDADMTEVRRMIGEEIGELKGAVAAIRPAPELPDIAGMIAEAVAAIPAPENGKDGQSVTIDDIAPMIAAEVERRVGAHPQPRDGKDGAPGRDGQSIDAVDVERMVAEKVEMAVAAIPVPKDGMDGKDGSDGADGVGLAGALIDRSGELVVTLTNGEVKTLGPVVGRDGEPGKCGADGADGVGFDDMTEEMADDGRTIIRRYSRGDQVKEFRHSLSVVLDRGVYQEGAEYKPGDGVTWAGSFWIAQKDTSAKPDSGDGWRLSVKRGRDGRDGVMKETRPLAPVRVGTGKAV